MKNLIIFIIFILSVIMAGFIYFCTTSIMTATNDDMAPLLSNGTHYVINRYAYRSNDPHPGEIIVFKNLKMEKAEAKRVIGVPGDTLSMDDGILIRNDKILKESYANTSTSKGIPAIIIPCEQFFVLNDRRDLNNDSRSSEVGLIKKSDIIGQVIFIF